MLNLQADFLRRKTQKMENVFGFKVGSVDNTLPTISTDVKDELITHSASFIQLYDQYQDLLQGSSMSSTKADVQVDEKDKDTVALRVLASVFGGVLGSASGTFIGGVCGALGTVAAATFLRICEDINAVDATVGFIGGVFGGAVGGAFSGTVGGTVCAAAIATGYSFKGVISDVIWVSMGIASGSAIGGIFGGKVGAWGGAIGGAYGAKYAAGFAVDIVEIIVPLFSNTKESKEQKKEIKKEEKDFHKMIQPLVEELKTIQMISGTMAPSVAVLSVAEQTATTLAAVTVMETKINESTEELTNCVSRAEEAATQGIQVTEELEKMRAEVGELLVSLRKP